MWIPGSGVQRRGVDDVRLADLTGPLADQAGFDTVLLLCGNLGVVGGWAPSRRLLGRLHQDTRLGAVVLADTVDAAVTSDPAHLA